MKHIAKMWQELDRDERIEVFKDIVGWACLMWIVFMLSIIGG